MTPQEKTDGVRKKNDARYRVLMEAALRLLDSPRNIEWRGARMTEITDELAAMVAPVSPCKKGCAHCCYQSIVISSWEANLIAERTGKKIADFAGLRPGGFSRDQVAERFSGVACPFLVGNECSIYEVRPLICRTHISVADDPTPCDIKNNPGATVPYFNFGELNMIQGFMVIQAGCKLGDIRDFFNAHKL